MGRVIGWMVVAGVAGLLGVAASAEVVARDVEYTHGDVTLVGYLAYDDAVEGKRPGVLVVHEWWGLNEYAKQRARMLAELGYVAFAADMYGKGKVTEDPKVAGNWAGHMSGNVELWRARAMEGLARLKAERRTDADRLAAIGYCFGGSTVMQLAYAGAELDGVVSFHGSLPPAPDDAKIEAEVLACHGAADGFVSAEQQAEFERSLNKAGAAWTLIAYGGAKHSFTNPNADDYGVKGVAYDKRADRRSWSHMRTFFDAVFGDDEQGR